MNRIKKDIGDSFQSSLENYKIPTNDFEWLSLEKELYKMRFFKFSFYSFNIYYCLILAATFIMAAGLTIHSLIQNSSIEKTSSTSNSEAIKTVLSSSTHTKDNTFNNKTKNSKISSTKSPKESVNPLMNLDHNTSDKQVPNQYDSIKAQVAEQSLSPIILETKNFIDLPLDEPKKAKPKKIICITKQDTLIINDTIQGKPANLRKKGSAK